MYKGILIDLGNTICYNQDFDFNRGLKAVYDKAINPKVNLEEFLKFTYDFKKHTFDKREMFEINFKNYLQYLINYFNLEYNESLGELEIVFSDNFENLVVIGGVIDFLEYLKSKNKKIVILSNSTLSSATLKHALKKLNLLKYFDRVYSSGDSIFRKPSKEYFDLGIKYYNNDLNSFYYIGNDYYFDILGATNLGVKTIWFNENKEPNTNNLDIIIFKKYSELIKILEEEDKNV